VSLVCVDELKLLRDIEQLLKTPLEQEIVEGYTPDPSIRAEPIQRGRPQRAAGHRQGSRRNGPPSGRSRKRSRSSNGRRQAS
jgi:ATP-dependent RNA helicase RhlE